MKLQEVEMGRSRQFISHESSVPLYCLTDAHRLSLTLSKFLSLVKEEGVRNLGYSVAQGFAMRIFLLGHKVSNYIKAVALFMDVLFGFPEGRCPSCHSC